MTDLIGAGIESAALLWFQMLRARKVNVSYWQYVRMGVPVTLIATVLATLTLLAKFAPFG